MFVMFLVDLRGAGSLLLALGLHGLGTGTIGYALGLDARAQDDRAGQTEGEK